MKSLINMLCITVSFVSIIMVIASFILSSRVEKGAVFSKLLSHTTNITGGDIIERVPIADKYIILYRAVYPSILAEGFVQIDFPYSESEKDFKLSVDHNGDAIDDFHISYNFKTQKAIVVPLSPNSGSILDEYQLAYYHRVRVKAKK